MNQDFTTQLRLELREAALREERRTPMGQRLVRARRGVPGPAPLAVAALVALLAVAVAIGALKLRGEPEPVTPRVIQTFTVANGLSSLAPGFGAVWATDAINEEILRIDPESHKVVARIPSSEQTQLATGAGSVWALGGDLLTAGAFRPVQLERIDPRTDRVVARIPMRAPSGDNFAPLFVMADEEHVWVCGAVGALRIDPERNEPDRYVPYPGEPTGLMAEGELVWVLLPGGRLHALDARTGKVVTDIRLRDTDDAHLGPGRPGTLTVGDKSHLSLIERATGRVLWRTSLGETVRDWIVDGDAFWVHVSRAPDGRDKLVRLDADTGRPTGQVGLRDEDATGLAKVGRDIWVATPIGTIRVVR